MIVPGLSDMKATPEGEFVLTHQSSNSKGLHDQFMNNVCDTTKANCLEHGFLKGQAPALHAFWLRNTMLCKEELCDQSLVNPPVQHAQDFNSTLPLASVNVSARG